MKIILLFASIMILTNCQQQVDSSLSTPSNTLPPLRTVTMNVGNTVIDVEVAITYQEQMQGLMHRESMPENHGMLFVYSQPKYMSFWMKNTFIPLSIAYIREDGIIGNIEDMVPQQGTMTPVERYNSKYKSLYALEMNQGWFEKQGVKAGDRIEIPTEQIHKLMNAL